MTAPTRWLFQRLELRRKREDARVRFAPYRTPKTYQPLDDALSDPALRILRALRHFDWIQCADLLDAMDIPDCDRATYRQALKRLRMTGLALGITTRGWYEYRLSALGAREIERRLRLAGCTVRRPSVPQERSCTPRASADAPDPQIEAYELVGGAA